MLRRARCAREGSQGVKERLHKPIFQNVDDNEDLDPDRRQYRFDLKTVLVKRIQHEISELVRCIDPIWVVARSHG